MLWALLASGIFAIIKKIWPFLLGIAVTIAVIVWWKSGGSDDEPLTVAGKVLEVSAGNRFSLQQGRLRRCQVQLKGLGVPAGDQPYGKESREFLQRLIGNKNVEVETTKRGDPLHGTVYSPEGWNINLEQVREGMAWCTASASAPLRAAEKEAKKAKRGLWQTYKSAPVGEEETDEDDEENEAEVCDT